MNSQDDRGSQQRSTGSQQNTGNQSGGQPQQQVSGGGQQGSQSGSMSNQQGNQQEAYSPSGGQQGGGALSRRGGSGTPSLFGTRSNPFDMLRRLDEDVDRLFQQIWGGGRNLMRGRGGADAQSVWMPQVEVREEGGKLHVCADLPGLKKEDVKLTLEGDQLVLQGERQSSREEGQQGGSFYHSERSYGSFYRSIPLPEGVDPQTVQADFKEGVLDVTFDAPRTAQQQRRQIEIR